MNQQLYGLRYNYEQRGGTCLVFDRDGGLKEEELSRIQMKMLQTGQVPRLLPFSAEQTDGDITLAYEVGGRRMLKQAVRTDGITLPQVLQLLVSLSAMLEECRSYMLRERGFLLQESFIFVGHDVADVSFVYLPMQSLPLAQPIEEDVRQLIEFFGKELQPQDRQLLEPFISYCQSGAFRIKELKRRLIEKLTNPVPRSGERNGRDGSQQKGSLQTVSRPHRVEPLWIDQYEEKLQTPPIEQELNKRLPYADEAWLTALRKHISIIVASIGGIGSAWIWSLYVDSLTPSFLQLAVGVSLLSAAAWLLVTFAVGSSRLMSAIPARFRRKLNQDNNELPSNRTDTRLQDIPPVEDPIHGQMDFIDSIDSEDALIWSQASSTVIPFPIRPIQEESIQTTTGPMTAERYYATLGQQTTLLRPSSDATVLLRPDFGLHLQRNSHAFFEIDAEHPPMRIPLTKPIFVLGRRSEHSDYRLDANGVSRQHVEITLDDGAYTAKDLGSTNGTLLNGEGMVPYRSYPLQESDCLTIAHFELRFRFIANARKTV